MSKISIEDVQKLASLSALSLDDKQLMSMRDELSTILEHVEHLSEVDTTGVAPTYQVTGLRNVTREDVVEKTTVTTQDLLHLAPDTVDGQIKVPRVLE